MLIAWSLDQVIDLNNGLDVSHPLSYKEEVLCLGTVFGYSWILLFAALVYLYIIREDTIEESMSKFMSTFYILALCFILHNALVRTYSPLMQDDTQNLILVPLICLSFLF